VNKTLNICFPQYSSKWGILGSLVNNKEYVIEGRYNWRGPPYHTPFEKEIFVWCAITACTKTNSEYFLYKWSTVFKASIIILLGGPHQLYLPFYYVLLGQYAFIFLYFIDSGEVWSPRNIFVCLISDKIQ